ncbi:MULTISPECIES: biotin/lipoyl-containing protein [unclassified Shinella]|uniref:biotin/lipoyl-containing protein n=1 Tax=unclassified Shinella TaxID=2643062 RepID=UPI00225CAB16|nr:biotin/lipoyl-containing protein [Shinella sp. YE25]MDC7258730.1 biotin attachment protein [Shinella sp. YE25]CAI0334505.1 Dihydrolipoamide acetyltransferase component (E2) of acetoin dehydrogenase complex [Rhizobiaceae bacterium]CAK7260681.1 Biotin-requiring enzyme [Shinella sp. WSC3-e]
MRVEVLLPQWGMGMSEGTVTDWLKKVGDRVSEDEPLAEIEAEKATQELESPATGVLTEIIVQKGEEAKVRSVLAIIETDD